MCFHGDLVITSLEGVQGRPGFSRTLHYGVLLPRATSVDTNLCVQVTGRGFLCCPLYLWDSLSRRPLVSTLPLPFSCTRVS